MTEAANRNGRKADRVGYMLRMYPRFTQTFVVNEILELERQRFDVNILSLKKPADGRFHVYVVPQATSQDTGTFLRAVKSALVGNRQIFRLEFLTTSVTSANAHDIEIVPAVDPRIARSSWRASARARPWPGRA